MKKKDYQTSIVVETTPQNAFKAINNVSKWWSEDFEGSLKKLNDVFTVHFGKVYITIKVTELVPDKKIIWYVTDCNKPWLKNKKEWNDTQLQWELSEKDGKTQINFTHVGLVPEVECFGVCSNAWDEYLHESLVNLIQSGKGKPTAKMTR